MPPNTNNTNHINKTIANSHTYIELNHHTNKIIFGKINVLYLNINSIANKLDTLEIHLQLLSQQNNNACIHVIALTEVRIHEHITPCFNLPSYESFFRTRTNGQGGCALFIHNSISCSHVDSASQHGIEMLAVRLIEPSFSIMVIYKQPEVNNDAFIHTFNSYIENRNNLIIVGDMNLNLLSDTQAAKSYIDMITSNGFVCLNKINTQSATRSATRSYGEIQRASNTIIDHVLTDRCDCSFNLSLSDVAFSDHKQIVISINPLNYNSHSAIANESIIDTVDFKSYHKDVDEFLATSNISSFESLINGLTSCLNNNKSTKTIESNGIAFKPWLNNELLTLINERNRYYALLKKSPTNKYLISKYKELSCLIVKKGNS